MTAIFQETRSPAPGTALRPCVHGKFLFAGDHKLYLHGVTYGTFRPNADGDQYPDSAVVEQDFNRMSASGINAIKTYTLPPRWLLDLAYKHQLWIFAGLPCERYLTYVGDKKRRLEIENTLENSIAASAGHPAILCYSVGNEIPASMVRWYGKRRIERFLARIYRTVKTVSPRALVTYTNYPSTEYLQLPFLDFVSFNVFLEEPDKFKAYLARLQNLCGERPLVMTELGLDSRRHGETAQADSIDWQTRLAFAGGSSGVFVYSWTDEWYRGGSDVEDWDFGLTRRDRTPKPALAAVTAAFSEVPFAPDHRWPLISVVVCTYNGARTIRDTLENLRRLEYPNYEVIVVDDGSKDATPTIAGEYGFRLISTENRGLSNARNTGMEAAKGEIVAYIDDDAYPDPQWLTYLAASFMSSSYAAIGGPNIAPSGDGWVADCVANSPGGPIPVLVSDTEAEHIAGCNMAFRKANLKAIGGFDPQFRTAGDDVDVCWRILERGWKLGYSPAAVVWHHRRNSLRIYVRQQVGYGKAEAMLERKWPERYNAPGHVSWTGRLYGRGLTRAPWWSRQRIYHGSWGSAPFQSLYQALPSTWQTLSLMPEWYFLVLGLAVLSALSASWPPLLIALPPLLVAVLLPLFQAIMSAAYARFPDVPGSRWKRLQLRSVVALMHLLQPIARLRGRLRYGLTPWRSRGGKGWSWPRHRVSAVWSERWRSAEDRLASLEKALRSKGAVVLRGGTYDGWDIEVRGGMFGAVRTLIAVEEHGNNRQVVRYSSLPRFTAYGAVVVTLLSLLCSLAALDRAWVASAFIGAAALALALRIYHEYASSTSITLEGLKQMDAEDLK